MNPIKSVTALLAAAMAFPANHQAREIKSLQNVQFNLHPPFASSFTAFGATFYGKTRGTRKAMRAAAKRRRIRARLPK